MKTAILLAAMVAFSPLSFAASETHCVVTTTTVTGDSSGALPVPSLVNQVCNISPEAALNLYYLRQVMMGEMARKVLESDKQMDEIVTRSMK